MHHTFIAKCIQPKGWIMDEKSLFKNILCNVGKGWLSISVCRARSQPFWTHMAGTSAPTSLRSAFFHSYVVSRGEAIPRTFRNSFV